MGKLIERITNSLVRRGLRRGLLEGSNLWLALGAVAFVVRFISRPEEPKLVSERLALGESIVVTHLPAPASGRKAGKKGGDAGRDDGTAGQSAGEAEVGG
jgi:hypothetical protein